MLIIPNPVLISCSLPLFLLFALLFLIKTNKQKAPQPETTIKTYAYFTINENSINTGGNDHTLFL